MLFCRIRTAEARGYRTANGFVILKGSSAVFEDRPGARSYPNVIAQRKQLIEDNGPEEG
jgi:hypothetical protein